jgi:DNA-binding beta-propeller fold protein YncE
MSRCHPRSVVRSAATVALALALVAGAAGCGSASSSELPPAAMPAPSPPLTEAPAGRVVRARSRPALDATLRPSPRARLDGGRQVAVVDGRERVVETFDVATGARTGRADAGVGPTQVATDGGNYLYVTDTDGGALLVFHIRPRLELIRRYPLPGSPYAIAIDRRRHRLYITQTGLNRLTVLTAEGRPHLVERIPTVRGPAAVAVDAATGRVAVAGGAGEVLQLLDPARSP